MRHLPAQLGLLLARTPASSVGGVGSLHRDDEREARLFVMLIFPVLAALQWSFVAPEAHGYYLAAAASTVIAAFLGDVVVRLQLPRACSIALPTASITAVWVMVASSGGVSGGFAAMLLVPLMWFVVYADRGDVLLALVVVSSCVLFATDRLLPGLPHQGSLGARSSFVIVAIALVVGMRPLVVQLRRNVELAQRAQHSLRASHSALAHDLRTPLTAICGLATLTQQRLDTGDEDAVAVARDYALRINQLGWRAESIIDGVLELSRGGAGLPSATTIDVRHMLEAISADLPTLTVATASLPARIVGHAPSVERLFRNLLANAARHGVRDGRPGVRVVVSCVSEETQWQFTVQDDGGGFAPDDIPTLLEPWRRGTGSDPAGHGLGLAIVAAIVAQHGGTVHACNGQDGGARVTFTLARMHAALGAPPAPGRRTHASWSAARSRRVRRARRGAPRA